MGSIAGAGQASGKVHRAESGRLALGGWVVVLCLLGCSSTGKQARPTQPETTGGGELDQEALVDMEAEPTDAPAEEAATGDAPAVGDPGGSDPEQKASPPPAPPKPKPSEQLTSAEAYLLNDPSSELAERLTEKCRERLAPPEDPAKLAQCRAEARDKFLADAFVFRRDGEGRVSWVIYQRRRSELTEIFTQPVSFIDETDEAVTLRPAGGGRGTRPVFKGRPDVRVYFERTGVLVLADPDYGKLVYHAKIGLIGSRQ